MWALEAAVLAIAGAMQLVPGDGFASQAPLLKAGEGQLRKALSYLSISSISIKNMSQGRVA